MIILVKNIMPHIKLKASQEIKLDFNSKELNSIEVPEKNKELLNSYLKSKKYSEDFEYNILLFYENYALGGFDYLYNGKKLIFPELNPVILLLSSAKMSALSSIFLKQELLDNYNAKNINNHLLGQFIQQSMNCVINLQVSIECFVNNIINEKNYKFYGKKQNERKPTTFEKIEVLDKIFSKNFKKTFAKEHSHIKELIQLRNELIHLKPKDLTSNTKFKFSFRKMFDLNFEDIFNSVECFLNYYEENLIEDCNCGREFMYVIEDIK